MYFKHQKWPFLKCVIYKENLSLVNQRSVSHIHKWVVSSGKMRVHNWLLEQNRSSECLKRTTSHKILLVMWIFDHLGLARSWKHQHLDSAEDLEPKKGKKKEEKEVFKIHSIKEMFSHVGIYIFVIVLYVLETLLTSIVPIILSRTHKFYSRKRSTIVALRIKLGA